MLARIAWRLPIYREILQIRGILAHIRSDVAAIRDVAHTMETMTTANFYQNEYHNERNRDPRRNDPLRLQHYAFQVNSQNGEDGMIHEIFRRIGVSSKVFVEIGVEDGVECNTAFLLSQGWKGYWIDANDAFLHTLSSRTDLQDGCLIPYVSFVNRENIGEIFKQLGIPEHFDLLSIDIDQNTYFLWEALHEYAPSVVVIEYNAALPPDIDWKARYEPNRAWDRTQNYGASLKALEVLGTRLGYSLVGCDFNGINAFFVRNDLVQAKFAAPFAAENHYEPPRHLLHRRGHPRSILDR